MALLAFLYMGGHMPGQNKTVNVTVEAPKVKFVVQTVAYPRRMPIEGPIPRRGGLTAWRR